MYVLFPSHHHTHPERERRLTQHTGEKYAYGCSELLFYPIKDWWSMGIITPLFKRFLRNKNMPLSAKITIMSYVGTYYAIGSAALLTLLNYFLVGWLNGWLDHFYMSRYVVLSGVDRAFGD